MEADGLMRGWFTLTREPLCLLSAEARILAISDAAREFLARPNGFHLVAGYVMAVAPPAHEQFCAALGAKRPQIVLAPTAAHKSVTLALVSPSPNRTALVRFRRPGYAQLSAYLPLTRHYGLSPKQARIVADIVLGRSLEQIALKRGTTLATVRSHLKAIFEKLDITHRADIATVLLRHIF